MEPIPNDDGFPHNERRYMCEKGIFGGPLHCLTAANRFSILNAIIIVVLIPFAFADKDFAIAVGVYMFFEATSLLLIFFGLRYRRRCLLLFHMMFSVFTLSLTAIALIVIFGSTCAGDSIFGTLVSHSGVRHSDLDPLIRLISAFVFIFVAFCFLLHCWYLNVVNRCDTYLKDYKEHLKITLLAARNVCNHPGCQESVGRVPSKTPPPYTLPL